jgi:hypothetical protein
MAKRKMTFSVPEPLTEHLQERDLALIQACEIANADLDVALIEQEFDGIADEMAALEDGLRQILQLG